ncbi:MAG: hypothetical protein WCT04_03645 [Planctomycetota bacterium]
MRSKPLGQLLVENGDATSEQVSQALKAQDKEGGLIGGILLRMGACRADAIGHALHKQVQVTDVQCEEMNGSDAAVKLVSKEICTREKLCPFEVLGNMLCVVMANPLNRKAILEIEAASRLKVKAFKAPWPKISDLVERSYSGGSAKASVKAPLPPLEDLSFELDDEPVHTPAVKAPAPTVKAPIPAARPAHDPHTAQTKSPDDFEPMPLDLDDIIIPASDPDDESAGAHGILDVPDETIPLPSNAATHYSAKMIQPPTEPKIKGLDDLDFTGGELVDIAKRKPNAGVKTIPKRAEPRVAKVNVDLEHFDHAAAGEVIDDKPHHEQDVMDEIQHGDVEAGDSRQSVGVLVALKIVPDSYFYAGSAPKNAPRSDDLMDIIEALPVAEVVAESISDFERSKAHPDRNPTNESGSLKAMTGTAMAGKSRVDLQRAPATPMAAIRIGEGEFQKLTLTCIEDECATWEWNVASTGPVLVDTFEE